MLEAEKQDIEILILSEWLIKEQLKSGELITLMNSWQPSLYEEGGRDIHMVFIDNKYMKPTLRAFIDFITQQLSE